ncbi:MAG: ABC transporter ATP-binding protein [Flavobacteriales bacterium]|nr:ABC transporter ATP-binding protein [Flavobacteriales bacterium]
MSAQQDLVIQVEDLRKRYRLGVMGSDLLAEEAAALWGRMRGRTDAIKKRRAPEGEQRVGDYFWSLQGVSFEVRRGEMLGIIGRNGAGKSTLLKLLSRISLPTEGTIRMRGKVSSLLEVGTGFHPELTGRENIYLNGAILGMRKAEINRKLDQIIAFSGIEHHLDSPIKRYSSGMKVRLGFSVAAHLDPEILIVDEVLAVGDAEFQRKCLGSMREVASSGRTILFVSHNLVSLQSLCTRAIWLEKGRLRAEGPTDELVRDYLLVSTHQHSAQEWAEGKGPGTEDLRLVSVRAISDEPSGAFTTDSAVRIEIELDNLGIADADLDIRLQVRTGNDAIAFSNDLSASQPARFWNLGRSKVACTIPAQLLNSNTYRYHLVFFRQGRVLFKAEDVLSFDVHEGARSGSTFRKMPGAVRPMLTWQR